MPSKLGVPMQPCLDGARAGLRFSVPSFELYWDRPIETSVTLAIDIFFIPIRLSDVLEVLLLSLIFYWLYRSMRGTIAIQILAAIFGLFLLDSIFTFLDMRVFKTFFRSISEVLALAIIILFQPEIRRVLSLIVGNNPLVKRFIASNKGASDSTIHQVMLALNAMSRSKLGALIVFERSTGLRTYIESGSQVNAPISHELLTTIFATNAPLHDGAVVIRGEQIVAAKCILPVSQSRRINEQLGLRHRAALGLSEQTDAFVIVVSEETGSLSIANDGRLRFNMTEAELKSALVEALAPSVIEEAPEAVPAAAALNPTTVANG